MTDADYIAEAEDPKFTSVEEICARENLDQKRLLGHMIYRNAFKDPVFAFDSPEDVAKAVHPGQYLVLDNWQVRDYAAKNRLPDIHAQAPIV